MNPLARRALSAIYLPFTTGLLRWAAIPIRLIVGYGFMAHGFAKLMRGPDAFIAILHAMGVPAPAMMGWATILVELIGGFSVLAGAFVPLVSFPMAAVMIVAALTVHLPYGFSSIKLQAITATGAKFGSPGYELDLVYLACLATLVLGGSGPFSVDSLFAKALANSRRDASSPRRDEHRSGKSMAAS
jgi:putative oxidoreductase